MLFITYKWVYMVPHTITVQFWDCDLERPFSRLKNQVKVKESSSRFCTHFRTHIFGHEFDPVSGHPPSPPKKMLYYKITYNWIEIHFWKLLWNESLGLLWKSHVSHMKDVMARYQISQKLQIVLTWTLRPPCQITFAGSNGFKLWYYVL